MQDKMEFIYSLCYNNQVFYVGCSANLVARYRAHLNSYKSKLYGKTKTAQFIKAIIERGEFPTIQIIDYLPMSKSWIREAEIISVFSQAGQPLTNHVHSGYRSWAPSRIPEVKTRKIMIKIVRYKQMAFIHQWAQQNIPAPERYSIESPSNPF